MSTDQQHTYDHQLRIDLKNNIHECVVTKTSIGRKEVCSTIISAVDPLVLPAENLKSDRWLVMIYANLNPFVQVLNFVIQSSAALEYYKYERDTASFIVYFLEEKTSYQVGECLQVDESWVFLRPYPHFRVDSSIVNEIFYRVEERRIRSAFTGHPPTPDASSELVTPKSNPAAAQVLEPEDVMFNALTPQPSFGPVGLSRDSDDTSKSSETFDYFDYKQEFC